MPSDTILCTSQDSQLQGKPPKIEKNGKPINEGTKEMEKVAPLLRQAVDELASLRESNGITIIPLKNVQQENGANRLDDFHVDMHIIDRKIHFFTSYHVGWFSTKLQDGSRVIINIQPRFGREIFTYMLSYAVEIMIPEGFTQSVDLTYKFESEEGWLILLLWCAQLEAATSIGYPISYVNRFEDLHVARGRIDLRTMISRGLIKQHLIPCFYRELTADNIINRTIRYCHRLLSQKFEISNPLLGISREVDQHLEMLGVAEESLTGSEIEKIQYPPMYENYRPLMEICKLIIEQFDVAHVDHDKEDEETTSKAVFLDMSELWENYLLSVLQRNRIMADSANTNLKLRLPLFDKDEPARYMRPDILVGQGGQWSAIIDAKYKDYHGKKLPLEDRYQIAVYMFRYAGEFPSIRWGALCYPCEESPSEEKFKLRSDKGEWDVYLLPFPIMPLNSEKDTRNRLECLRESERQFIHSVREHLKKN